MKTNTALISKAVTSLLAFGSPTMSAQAANDADIEKSYGVTTPQKNERAENGHACAGQAKTVRDRREWISSEPASVSSATAGADEHVELRELRSGQFALLDAFVAREAIQHAADRAIAEHSEFDLDTALALGAPPHAPSLSRSIMQSSQHHHPRSFC